MNTKNSALNEKVELGSILQASAFQSGGIKVRSSGKQSETSKASRANMIKSTFELAENKIAEKGKRTVYLVVKKSSGDVLPNKDNNTFTIDGNDIIYSESIEIEYVNEKENVDIYYKVEDKLSKGKYQIEIFIDGHSVGSDEFVLK